MLKALDHVNLHTDDPEALADWYESVLGLKRGPRPNFSIPGIWHYLDEDPVVHLVKVDEKPPRTTPSLEHFAFRAEGMAAFQDTLAQHGVSFERVDIEEIGIAQFNVRDPMGTHIHVDFSLQEESRGGG